MRGLSGYFGKKTLQASNDVF